MLNLVALQARPLLASLLPIRRSRQFSEPVLFLSVSVGSYKFSRVFMQIRATKSMISRQRQLGSPSRENSVARCARSRSKKKFINNRLGTSAPLKRANPLASRLKWARDLKNFSWRLHLHGFTLHFGKR